MHPKDLKIEDFTYELPDENIAYKPVEPRDSSKLLIYKNHKISDDIYRNLKQHLPQDAVLVFNDTRVIKSRIKFQRQTGAIIEIFCLEPNEEFVDYAVHFQKTEKDQWRCLVGNIAKWKEPFLEKTISVQNQEVLLTAKLIDRLPDSNVVEFSWTPKEISVGEIIENAGLTPLPPYIKREAKKEDESTYQTVYSSHEGSVAAPTAGLHFSQEMLQGFKEKHIPTLFTTLHVGAGTFKPVSSEKMADHVMHNEWMDISIDFLKQLESQLNKTIISVGTTSTRTLESIYWMGNKICNNPDISIEELCITQWEPYEDITLHSSESAVSTLIQWMKERHMQHLIIETGIIIAPSYKFKIIKGLITNFHQPKSTLLLLVAALVGKNWKDIYTYALQNNFRFLSYGDGSLLMR
ncbi:MAG: S-adenosylmethionine:tRNA ribosyltransferase-isomerase [Brumimicrobium sp.]|nr:S-adenosylmethionine:tRNA ribosyltransferase-isomerase [Brumimicrobium sp.]